MIARCRPVRLGTRRRFALVISGAVLLCGFGSAQSQPLPDGANEPLIGCGKGRSMAALHEALSHPPAPSPRGSDAYADTNVLCNELDILLDPETETLTGSNTMTIRSETDSLSEFTFRLRENFTITEALINGTTPLDVTSTSATTRIAHFDDPFALGEEFTLTIRYTGVAESRGFGSINFSQADDQPLVFSLSEPYYAYTWWPAKDGDFGEIGDNTDKARLTISITAPNHLTTVANGLLVGIENVEPDLRKYTYSTDYEMTTYLVCFSTGLYNTWNSTYFHPGGAMPVNFYVIPSKDTSSNRDLWDKCVDMLGIFAEIYGEYPFIDERYGIYYFGFGGGMEHQTMSGQGSFGESLTAHELGHQWWGDLVTCKTWQDIWLNEGFASYSEALWEERKPGSGGHSALIAWMNVLRPSAFDDSVYVPEADLDNVGRIFSTNFTYRKAAWVLHQLRHVVGDETFFDIIAEYRSRFAFDAADTADFIEVCSDVHGEDLQWFFDQWVFGIGVPSYSVGWEADQVGELNFVKLTLRQTQSDDYGLYRMPIDIEITTTEGVERHTIINDRWDQNIILAVDGSATQLELDPDGWILHDGISEGGQYVPGGPVVMTAWPRPGDVIDVLAASRRITINFDSDIQSDPSYYTLVGDTTGGRAFEHSYDEFTRTVTLDLDAILLPDTYVLTASSLLTGLETGLALDGEIADPDNSNSLPSGDGEPAGDMLYRFQVIGELPEPEPEPEPETPATPDDDSKSTPDGVADPTLEGDDLPVDEPEANTPEPGAITGDERASPSSAACGAGLIGGFLTIGLTLALVPRRR